MYNIGDQVRILYDPYVCSTCEVLGKIGTITAAVLPPIGTDVAMYDIHIDNEVHVFFDDELELVQHV